MQMYDVWKSLVKPFRAAKPEIAQPQTIKNHKRRFAAAKISRLNSGWETHPTSNSYELSHGLSILRARAREAARNNSHFKKFVWMAQDNIIGPHGIQLQCRARKARKGQPLDVRLNKLVEDKFWEWTHRENCSYDGQTPWVELQRLYIATLMVDGEVLIRHHDDPENPFGYTSELISADYLDEGYNEITKSGNRIIMSIEYDDRDRPVAYYLTQPVYEMSLNQNTSRKRVRIAASEISHDFIRFDIKQRRGLTWFAAALIDAKDLKGYKEATITGARVGAQQIGLLMEQVPDDEEFDGDDEIMTEIEIDTNPASVSVVPAGYDFKDFKPNQPTQNHEAFYRSILMDVASGLNVNYFTLAGDLAAVNFSSARVGLAQERDLWRGLQRFTSDHFCRDIFNRWLKQALLTGSLNISSSAYWEVRNPYWRPRGWDYIEPQKDMKTDLEGLAGGLFTLTDILSRRGIDIIDHLETLQQEKELLAEYGIELAYGNKPEPAKPPTIEADDKGGGSDEETGEGNDDG